MHGLSIFEVRKARFYSAIFVNSIMMRSVITHFVKTYIDQTNLWLRFCQASHDYPMHVQSHQAYQKLYRLEFGQRNQ